MTRTTVYKGQPWEDDHEVLAVRIGVTAVWHSHRHTCSIQKVERFTRENRLYRKPANIPTCGTGSLAVYGGEDVTPGASGQAIRVEQHDRSP